MPILSCDYSNGEEIRYQPRPAPWGLTHIQKPTRGSKYIELLHEIFRLCYKIMFFTVVLKVKWQERKWFYHKVIVSPHYCVIRECLMRDLLLFLQLLRLSQGRFPAAGKGDTYDPARGLSCSMMLKLMRELVPSLLFRKNLLDVLRRHLHKILLCFLLPLPDLVCLSDDLILARLQLILLLS